MTLRSQVDAPTQAFREAAQTHEPAHAAGPDNLGPGRIALPHPTRSIPAAKPNRKTLTRPVRCKTIPLSRYYPALSK